MALSWDDTAGSMNTIDLLSASPTEIRDRNLRHISEEANQCQSENEPMPAAITAATAASASLLSSSSEQQNYADPSAVYQIDFDVEHLGKNKPQNKRMAIWKYGIPQKSASGVIIASHEAMLTWSTHSGKYTISVDGEEVFSSVAKGSVLEHKWRWSHREGRVAEDGEDVLAMRIVACRKPPVRTSRDFRCYEFLIGGKVFRELPVFDGDDYCGGERVYQNEENVCGTGGNLTSILDIVDPEWRSGGLHEKH